jgi:ribosomal protein L37AE/L43A
MGDKLTCRRCGSDDMHLEERAFGGMSAYCNHCGVLVAEYRPPVCTRCGSPSVVERLVDGRHLCELCRNVPLSA